MESNRKLWESCRKAVKRCENAMGKLWETMKSYGKAMQKLWESVEKV